MKILGVEFDEQLRWCKHLNTVISKAKKLLQGLRILRRNLGAESFLHVLTAQFYSKIYYGAAVWLGNLLSKDLKRLESVHYQALRIVHGVSYHIRPVSRCILDHDYRRATPLEWADYCTSKELIRIFNSKCPGTLFDPLESQSYLIKRPLSVHFFDTSNSRIGRQCFHNRAAAISSKLTFDWHFQDLSNDKIRSSLKQCLFKYQTSAASSIIPGASVLRREASFGVQRNHKKKKNEE